MIDFSLESSTEQTIHMEFQALVFSEYMILSASVVTGL